MKQCSRCVSPVLSLPPEFFEKLSPFNGQKEFLIPEPTICSSCNQQALLAFRNERSLYSRICDKTSKNIISMYRPNTKFPVYERSFWWTDDWDPKTYGKPYDFGKPFFEQFNELLKVVPQFSIYHAGTNENCDYSNTILDSRNSYLCFSLTHSEDCLYINMGDNSKDCVDCLLIDRSELLYECVDCERCYSSMFLERCIGCNNSQFCIDCVGCSHCVGCVNLRNATYCWFNENVGKAEYEKRLSEYTPLTKQRISALTRELEKHRIQFPRRAYELVEALDCSGDHIKHSRNCIECFDVHDMEDSLGVCRSYGTKSSQACYGVAGHELLYNIMSGRGHKFMGAVNSYDNSDCYYLYTCFQSQHLFGCVSLRRSEYCILNQQYSKNDYFDLLRRIILSMKKNGEWGNFFPAWLSPFGYNESVALDYYPLSEKDATGQGFLWNHFEAPQPKVEGTKQSNLAQSIEEIDDTILNQALICEKSGKLFRITRKELEFYRFMHVPLPTEHPDVRHKRRLSTRNPRQLYPDKCAQCAQELLTSYDPKRELKVFCDTCFQAEMA